MKKQIQRELAALRSVSNSKGISKYLLKEAYELTMLCN